MGKNPEHRAHPGSPSTGTRYKVLAWLGGAATIAYICRNSFGVAESKIRGEFAGWDTFETGIIMSAFQLTYSLDLRYNTALTKAQIAELQKALPKIIIHSNPTK